MRDRDGRSRHVLARGFPVRDAADRVAELAGLNFDITARKRQEEAVVAGRRTLNGYDAACRIRERPWGRATLLVALTVRGHEDDRRRAADAGFDRHITKPVDPARV